MPDSLLPLFASSWLLFLIFLEILFFICLLIPEKISHSKEKPQVSIIVAVWNEGERVKYCIESILKQDYPRDKTEIIIVGGGDSQTVSILRDFAKKGKIQYLYEKQRMGKWFSLNRAIAKSKNEIIAFTDAVAPAMPSPPFTVDASSLTPFGSRL